MDYHNENFVPQDRRNKFRECYSQNFIDSYSNPLKRRIKSRGKSNSILNSRNYRGNGNLCNETNFSELLDEKNRRIKGLENEIQKTKNSHYHLTNDDIRGKYGYLSKYPDRKTQSSVKFNIDNISPEKEYLQENKDNDRNPMNISPNGKSRTESTATGSSSKTSTNSAQVQINDIFFRMVIIPFLQKIIKQFLSSLVFKKGAQELNQRFSEMSQYEYDDYKKLDLLNDILKNLSYLNMQHIALVNKDIQYERASQEVAHLYGNASYKDKNQSLPRNSNNNYDTTILGQSSNMLNRPISTSDSVEDIPYGDINISLSPYQIVQESRRMPGTYKLRNEYHNGNRLAANYAADNDGRNSQGPIKDTIRVPTRGSMINPPILSEQRIPSNIRPVTNSRHLKYPSKTPGLMTPSKTFTNNMGAKRNGHPSNFEFHDSYKENM